MSDFFLLESGDELELESGDGSLLLETGEPGPSGLPTYWYGPVWPFGVLTVLVPGTGIAITDGYTTVDLESSEYAEAVAVGFAVYAPSANTDTVYFVEKAADGTFSKDNPGTVLLSLAPGEEGHIPEGNYGDNRYLCSRYGVDADDADNDIYVVAIMQ
jgi:hypothetical protein